MSYLKNILNEERDRLHALSAKYREQLAELPRGCASIKKRGGSEYLYMAFRKNGKVCFEYVGPLSSEQAMQQLKKIEKRQQIKAKLKQVQNDLLELEKALHGKKL